MTVVSALFMLPAGVIFPALVRAANTPPHSQTLDHRDRDIRRKTGATPKEPLNGEGHARQRTEKKVDVQALLPEGEGRLCVFVSEGRLPSSTNVVTEMLPQASLNEGLKEDSTKRIVFCF